MKIFKKIIIDNRKIYEKKQVPTISIILAISNPTFLNILISSFSNYRVVLNYTPFISRYLIIID